MNRTALTLLGGSASLTLIALGNPAHALMPPELRGDAGSATVRTNNSPLTQEDLPQSAQSVDARIKQLAQSRFGCTCANCMATVRQMIQQGQLSL
jgi:hypothetical protein